MKTTADALLQELMTASDLLSQPYQLSGCVTPESPGGQLTAFLPDGTPVDRLKHLAEVKARVRAYLDPPNAWEMLVTSWRFQGMTVAEAVAEIRNNLCPPN